MRSRKLSSSSRLVSLLGVAGLVAWLVLNLVTLDRYPSVSCDEAFSSHISYNLSHHGHLGIGSGLDVAGTDTNVVFVGRLYQVLLTFFHLIMGYTPWAARLGSLAMGLTTTFLLYRLGESMYNERVGLAAAVTFQVAWITLLTTHSGRPEAWLAAAVTFETWLLYRSLERPSFSRGLLAGVGAVLVADVHLNGMNFAIAAGILTLAYFVYKRNWKALAAFSLGGLVGLVYWLSVHLLSDVSAATSQLFSLYTRWGVVPWAELQSVSSGREGLAQFYWHEFIANNNYLSAFSAIYFVFGVIYTAFNRTFPSRFLIGYFMVANVAFAFLVPVKHWYYAMNWIPFLCLMAAIAMDGLASRMAGRGLLSRISAWALWLGMLVPLVVTFLAGDLFLLYKFRDITYQPYAQKLRALIPPGGVTLAEDTWWYARPGERYVSMHTADWLAAENGSPLTPADLKGLVNRFRPVYIVLDESWGCQVQQAAQYDALDLAVQDQCEYVGIADADGYTPSEVYFCETLIE